MALLEARDDLTIRTLNRPSPKDLADAMPGAHAVLVGLEKVDEALPQVDVLTLHCPLGEDTYHMVNRKLLGLMKPAAWLINAARGPLVDEAAPVEALSSGRLQAAGLDVLLREPPVPANPLLKLTNVVFSPHNAAAPLECNEKMSVRAAKNRLELFDGVLDRGYVVNPEALPNRRNV